MTLIFGEISFQNQHLISSIQILNLFNYINFY